MAPQRAIHRVELPLTERTVLELPGYLRAIIAGPLRPRRAQALGHNRPMLELWYEAAIKGLDVDVPVTVYVEGTGHLFTHRGEHVSTFVDGSFIWHVYASILPDESE